MRKKNLVLRLLNYMGKFKILQIVSLLISAVPGVISLGAYVYVYYVAQTLIAVQGNYALLDVKLI